ncbi:hypothetical protein [Micromonospora sp. AMSO12t]|uniref:hypothetical protein n=1 Tax=Micromonospora sp. AMSO12t TaxID=2650410 RepID=UPI001CED3C36|nr:hypothetical protein [Micromonospora sp. AMSO12t]
MAVPFMIGQPGAFVLYSGAEDAFLDWRDTLAVFGDVHRPLTGGCGDMLDMQSSGCLI